jgi:hypothetical protein
MAVRVGHLLNQSMCPEHAELSADGGRTPSALGRRFGWSGVQWRLQVPVAKTVNEKLAVIDGGQQFFVLRPGA